MKVQIGNLVKDIEKKEISAGCHEVDFMQLFTACQMATTKNADDLKKAGFKEMEVIE